MKSMMTFVFGLALILFVLIACQSSPIPTARLILAAVTPNAVSTVEMPTPFASPTPDVIFIDESACMDVCHVGEPVEQSVKPLPVDHAGRTTCLSCHATLDKPALPATHVGRMDIACSACHEENGVK